MAAPRSLERNALSAEHEPTVAEPADRIDRTRMLFAMNADAFLDWAGRVSGIPVSAHQLPELISSAARRAAGEAELAVPTDRPSKRAGVPDYGFAETRRQPFQPV